MLKFLDSQLFFRIVLVVFAIQAVWMAVSIRYPMLFDEMYHFGVIKIYTAQWSPLIISQPEQYDRYGSLMYGNASLYHYILSMPLRLVSAATESFYAQIIVLRLLNIFTVLAGLWAYKLLFLEMKLKPMYSHLSLLIYGCIPVVIFITATISYDNFLFPLTGLFLLFGVKIVNSKEFNYLHLASFLTVGLFAALIKFTFLPILTAGVVYVAYLGITRYGRGLYSVVRESFVKTNILLKMIISVALLVVATFFVLRYVVAVIKYSTPIPQCDVVLSESRCMTNNIYEYEVLSISSKSSRDSEPIDQYFLTWVKTNLLQLDTSAAFTPNGFEVGKALPVIARLMSFSAMFGFFVIVLMWKRFAGDRRWQFLTIISLTLFTSVFLFNAKTYYSANLDMNTQVRYLLTVMPIGIVMSVVALSSMLGKKTKVKFIILAVYFILCTQGGGAIKTLLNANEGWYWENRTIQGFNENAKDFIAPVVKE